MWGMELAVMAAMIAVNSVFAGYEIALASVNVGRLRRLAGERRPGAQAALAMKEGMEASLAVVQLGITLVGAVAAAVGGAGAEERIAPGFESRLGLSPELAEVLALATVVLPLTVVTILFGELIPKVFALRHPEWVCLRMSPAMRWFAFTVWPAVWFLESSVTAIMSWWRWGRPPAEGDGAAGLQELRAWAAVARASRLIGQREEAIILGAASLGTRPVREILLPAEHVATLDVNASLTDNLIAAHLDMHTRFPVVERKGDPQTIIGYVNVKDVVAALRLSPGQPTVRALVRSLPTFPADLPIAECLERLMREHNHIALVRAGDGRVAGIVTLEDILEELVGDIQDEYDRLPAHLTPSGAGWVCGGGLPLARLKAATGLDLAGDGATPPPHTLSDWVVARLGRPVRGGETVEADGVRVVVRKMRRQKVQEAQVTRGAKK